MGWPAQSSSKRVRELTSSWICSSSRLQSSPRWAKGGVGYYEKSVVMMTGADYHDYDDEVAMKMKRKWIYNDGHWSKYYFFEGYLPKKLSFRLGSGHPKRVLWSRMNMLSLRDVHLTSHSGWAPNTSWLLQPKFSMNDNHLKLISG